MVAPLASLDILFDRLNLGVAAFLGVVSKEGGSELWFFILNLGIFMWLNKLAKRFLVEFPAEVAKVFFSLVSESFEGVDWLVGVAQVSPPSPESSSSLIELLGEAGLGSTSLTASSAFLAASSSLEIVEEHSEATVRLDSGRSESANQSLDKWTKAKLS